MMSLSDYRFEAGEQFRSYDKLFEIVTREQFSAASGRTSDNDVTSVYMKCITTGDWHHYHYDGAVISSGTLHKCRRHTDMSESK